MTSKLRKFAAMINTSNDYSSLKWPLIINGFLVIFLFFMLIISYQSDAWFTYNSVNLAPAQYPSNTTVEYSHLIGYGSFGLWLICSHKYDDPRASCVGWTGETRPQYFNVVLVLMSISLYLTTLTIFPAWSAFILILYNANNQYAKYIDLMMWILAGFTVLTTAIVIAMVVLTGLTPFASVKHEIHGSLYITYDAGYGQSLLIAALVFSLICFVLIIITFIWKKYIEVKLVEAEKELLKQLGDDSYQPIWPKASAIPRARGSFDYTFDDPPPYDYHENAVKN